MKKQLEKKRRRKNNILRTIRMIEEILLEVHNKQSGYIQLKVGRKPKAEINEKKHTVRKKKQSHKNRSKTFTRVSK